MNEIQVQSNAHRQMLNITSQVRSIVEQAGIEDGVAHIYVPHTTAGVVINEAADPDVVTDLLAAYEALVPDVGFRHAEGNSDAHFLATVLGSSVAIPFRSNRLCLGTWQGVFFVELDGPRNRKVWVSLTS
jgi:secondary thiamine-phosphate synthase enzyme